MTNEEKEQARKEALKIYDAVERQAWKAVEEAVEVVERPALMVYYAVQQPAFTVLQATLEKIEKGEALKTASTVPFKKYDSPYAKAKKTLEAAGYTVGKCEHWNPFAKIRQDLFGCIDMIAMKYGEPLIAVQPTDITSVSKRMGKASEIAALWVSTGNRFVVLGYTPKTLLPPRVMVMRYSGDWMKVKDGWYITHF